MLNLSSIHREKEKKFQNLHTFNGTWITVGNSVVVDSWFFSVSRLFCRTRMQLITVLFTSSRFTASSSRGGVRSSSSSSLLPWPGAANIKPLLRWPNTVFACAFAIAIQRAHKDCKKTNMPSIERLFIHSTPALSVLFFSIIERSVLIALVFYYKDMLEKVTMQRTQQFSAFSFLPKEPS